MQRKLERRAASRRELISLLRAQTRGLHAYGQRRFRVVREEAACLTPPLGELAGFAQRHGADARPFRRQRAAGMFAGVPIELGESARGVALFQGLLGIFQQGKLALEVARFRFGGGSLGRARPGPRRPGRRGTRLRALAPGALVIRRRRASSPRVLLARSRAAPRRWGRSRRDPLRPTPRRPQRRPRPRSPSRPSRFRRTARRRSRPWPLHRARRWPRRRRSSRRERPSRRWRRPLRRRSPRRA